MALLEFDGSGRRSVVAFAGQVGEETREVHPLQTQLAREEERTKSFEDARVMYGCGLAMRLASEDAMGSEVARLPGLPSSHLMHETIRGDHERIDFSHVLNVPHAAPETTKLTLHERAERKFGLTPADHAYL
ncbi:hypothetical protein CTAYLR_003612 [Chrysophaeum taylorii]|uniref:Uncharacterized protein n=1 Tax=Chrysophaeum taylorii TaxID=2483200 RepID=A0AAD7XHZ1_9STRA|nr:hypothetical protein CTAYLR_003612 [Chrysophaeum taylorii]